jgi:hypothetical protein
VKNRVARARHRPESGCSRPQAAHPRRAAAPGAPLHRDAGQALKQLTHGAVAVTLNILSTDDDLGGSGLPSLFAVIGGNANHIHRFQDYRRISSWASRGLRHQLA